MLSKTTYVDSRIYIYFFYHKFESLSKQYIYGINLFEIVYISSANEWNIRHIKYLTLANVMFMYSV